jgi:hydrogenase maturation protease
LSAPAPVLVLGIGNPSRGDDALGPRFVEALAGALAAEIASGALELATDFQLQPEHALDLVGRTQVVFVDASVDAPPPFRYGAVSATSAGATMSHALAPGAVLETYRRVYGPPPPAAVLAIRGERFELGAPLTPRAAGHLAAALRFFLDGLAPGADPTARRRRRIEVEGEVGGVGLRPWIVGAARAARPGRHGGPHPGRPRDRRHRSGPRARRAARGAAEPRGPRRGAGPRPAARRGGRRRLRDRRRARPAATGRSVTGWRPTSRCAQPAPPT